MFHSFILKIILPGTLLVIFFPSKSCVKLIEYERGFLKPLHVKFNKLGFRFTKEEIKKFKLWPGGIVPYYIDTYSFDKVFRDRIRLVISKIKTQTGLDLRELHRPPVNEKYRWVFFVNRKGVLDCVDHAIENFTNQGVQKVVLGYDCLSSEGGLAGTILALAGVPPQHNAPNRDRYITVHMENILPDKKHLYTPIADTDWLFHGFGYDFKSAGHYGFHKYTLNGSVTIEAKKQVRIPVGEAKGLSIDDIKKIRMLYNHLTEDKLFNNIKVCSKLYKPGSKFDNFRNTGARNHLNSEHDHSKHEVINKLFVPFNTIYPKSRFISNFHDFDTDYR